MVITFAPHPLQVISPGTGLKLITTPREKQALIDEKTYQEWYERSVKDPDGFWGEHGKGVRGQYLAEFVGPVAYAAFKRIKSTLDPDERFNPGKLVTLARSGPTS